MKLRIASDFALPLDAITQTFAILAVRGAGKTYTAMVMVEEMLKADGQVIVVDPVGVTWGLRASADGKGPGLPIIVMGGDHGDVPLEEAGGELVADFAIDSRRSLVLDLSRFRKRQQVRFMTDFAERLYHRNRAPVHLLLDEADAFAPQKPQHGQERMLGAIEDLVRRGRARGIGVTMVTQRSAVLNKDVLTQVECLVAMRTISPQDRKAIETWIEVHGDAEGKRQVLESLHTLPKGTAWFWSPGWLGILKRIEIRKRETFDSSATPTVGGKKAPAVKLADVNLEDLRQKMAATIERAKQEDPNELRKRIRELEQQLAKTKNVVPIVAATDPKVIERAVTAAVEERDRLWLPFYTKLKASVNAIRDEANRAIQLQDWKSPAAPSRTTMKQTASANSSAPTQIVAASPASNNGDLTNPEKRILNAAAWLESIGVREPKQVAVAFLAGYAPNGGAFTNPRGALRRKGLLDYRGDSVVLTDEGRAQAETPPAALTREELHRRVLERLPGPEQRILTVLLAAYPEAVANDELAHQAGYEPNGGAFTNPRGRLRSLGLVNYRGGMVKAEDLLFV